MRTKMWRGLLGFAALWFIRRAASPWTVMQRGWSRKGLSYVAY
jgi:hypothetical protein